MSARKQLEYAPDPHKFDLVTDRWDNQGRRTGPRNGYRKFITGAGEYYERPVNSGNLWLENNQPAGRVICEFNDKGHIVKKEFDFTAEHLAYVPPPTGAEKIAGELAAERARSAQLEAELNAIRKERSAVQPVVKNHAPEPTPAAPKLTKRE